MGGRHAPAARDPLLWPRFDGETAVGTRRGGGGGTGGCFGCCEDTKLIKNLNGCNLGADDCVFEGTAG